MKMAEKSTEIAFVIATKDRPMELRRALKSLELQSCLPHQVIVVDGGEQGVNVVTLEYPTLNITYLRCQPPSAVKQRNLGIEKANPEVGLIGFLDDDVELEKHALERICHFWETASDNVAGAAFNMGNHPPLYASRLKSLLLTERLGIYSKAQGVVLPSGFQTMIGNISKNSYVKWLPTGAVTWRKNVLDEYQYDEWFSGYSYLEDLDFSYRVGKKHRLAVVADARYYHYPSSNGRDTDCFFGMREVSNRVYFVKKYSELSLSKCYLALLIRMLLSVIQALSERRLSYLKRAWGNIVGLLYRGVRSQDSRLL
jgi:GT2 family glycosyltransferase